MSEQKDKWETLAESQNFNGDLLDYATIEQHRQMLDRLSIAGNSASFIFDLFKWEYIYASQNFNEILGVDLRKLASNEGLLLTDSILHPDDNSLFEQVQYNLYSFLFSLPPNQRMDYKHIFSFRVRNSQNEYTRFVSQQQVLEQDKLGNIWLVMGIIDLAPTQNPKQGFECSILNYRTGKQLAISDFYGSTISLTPREKEVLGLIREGLLSKEISDKLSISINTVNIHRQNILQKTNTNSSLEAIKFAEKMGLV